MSSDTISDAEAHELVIQRIRSMTREEAQSWLDHVAEVFGPDEPTVATRVRNGARPKSAKRSKKASTKPAAEAVAA